MGSWDLAEFEDFAVRCLHFILGFVFLFGPWGWPIHHQGPPSQPITPQIPEKRTKLQLSPIPKPPPKNNQTLDLPLVPPSPIKTNQRNIQTEQETQSENPTLLENPVAIPITPIQSTVTAIQNPNQNRLQLPPLSKTTTTPNGPHGPSEKLWIRLPNGDLSRLISCTCFWIQISYAIFKIDTVKIRICNLYTHTHKKKNQSLSKRCQFCNKTDDHGSDRNSGWKTGIYHLPANENKQEETSHTFQWSPAIFCSSCGPCAWQIHPQSPYQKSNKKIIILILIF